MEIFQLPSLILTHTGILILTTKLKENLDHRKYCHCCFDFDFEKNCSSDQEKLLKLEAEG